MASAARPAIPAAERPSIGRLREQLRAAETAQGLDAGGRPLTLGIPAVDDALGGGLSIGALHEIAAARESAIASATGFALGVVACRSRETAGLSFTLPPRALASGGEDREPLARLRASSTRYGERGGGRGPGTKRPPTPDPSPPLRGGRGEAGSIVWIAEELSLAESGAAYGPGLDQAGIPPERLITVVAARGPEVLWAMEEALRCRAVGAVIGELRARTIDHVASRRLALAAAAGNTLGLILRPAPEDDASAAATRWIVGAASSLDGERSRVGPPRLAVHLARNRRGHLGTWIVEWDSVEQRFVLAAHSEPVVRSVADRPHRSAVA